MQLLKDKIINDGKVFDGNVLKVDKFLNHQIDTKLFDEMGREFKNRFKDTEVTKILTIEASGIGIAAITSIHFDYIPVVFAKKYSATNLSSDTYRAEVYSFTKKTSYDVRVSKDYLNEGDKVLIIDDFLANGKAVEGLVSIVRQAGAEIVGVGIAIEKAFQNARSDIEKQGIKLESLAIIKSMNNNKIVFK
ncbi:xanthine phosphoribosyltransferase [Clostridium sp. DL1XJH146]